MSPDDKLQEAQEFIEDNLKDICHEYQFFNETGLINEEKTPKMQIARDMLMDVDFNHCLMLLERAIAHEAIKHIYQTDKHIYQTDKHIHKTDKHIHKTD
jgi:predicted subunit of tRNA(5-methylaminomethyl-2-thiouridylate) methyltransferase